MKRIIPMPEAAEAVVRALAAEVRKWAKAHDFVLRRS